MFSAGEIVASYDSTEVHFPVHDSLGSLRAEVSGTGAVEETCANLPFGDVQTCDMSITEPNELHFTGKKRDTESGLDYFGARYYASNMGRFMSPDWADRPEAVPYSDLTNPQSLNLYGYVNNNSLSHADADGHSDCTLQKIMNFVAGNGYRTDAEVQGMSVAQTAASHRNSTKWNTGTTNISGSQVFKPGSNKCNEFVCDTISEAGKTGPTVTDANGNTRLPTASELADPNVTINGLSSPQPLGNAKPGDVIAQAHGNGAGGSPEGHAGIVVGSGRTASANANEGGKVTVDYWGFRNPNANPNDGERNGAASPPPVVRHPQNQ